MIKKNIYKRNVFIINSKIGPFTQLRGLIQILCKTEELSKSEAKGFETCIYTRFLNLRSFRASDARKHMFRCNSFKQ